MADEAGALTRVEIAALRDEIARAAIRDVMMRYCRGVDRADKALFLSAFHPDAHDNHGQYSGPAEPFAELTVNRIQEQRLGIQHTLGNMLIELDGDVARVETYFRATYRDKADPVTMVAFGGRYLDRFERRLGEWRIARRTVVNDWSWRAALPEDVQGTTGYPGSEPGAGDLVFLEATWAAV